MPQMRAVQVSKPGGRFELGKLVVVGVAPEPLSIGLPQIVMSRRSIQGWPCGTAKDSEDALRFSALAGVRPMIERYPLDKAAEAYDQMLSGRARFRVVLTIAS
jgi:D-arabinose 1-dehydrogenase-like Zn-dependent alcohol dehydrogenase